MELTNDECWKAVLERDSRGVRIGYALADSLLGRLLVAVTEKGVCRVAFGDSDLELVSALHCEYPNAQIDNSSLLRCALEQIVEYLSGQRPRLDLPVDVQASAFQARVWEELRSIPYGETRSYSEIASAIGQSKAARAVARACANNPVALIYPCHRVLRSDGSLSGYAWGTERKKRLLEMEAVND